jgi:hypothetical protein
MTTVDQLLTKLVNSTEPTVEDIIQKRDARVLRSMATAISGTLFITENQSKLLLKILRDNEKKLGFLGEEVPTILGAPQWSRIFREVDKTKKLYIGKNPTDDAVIVIEYAFSSPIRKILANLTKITDGPIISINNKIHQCDLTEKNIVSVLDALEPHGFEIDETLKNHYDTIKSWSEIEVKNQFQLTTITHTNFQKQITADLGIHTAINDYIIADRGIRYQYFTEKTEKNPENLTEIIAHRNSTKVWVDRNKFTLDDIVKSLLELKRFPTMFVFDGFNPADQNTELHNLANTLDNAGIYDGVGMYFRLPNNPIGKEFNDLVKEKQYNSQLDKTTKVVGVQNGKIPKFFLNNEWKPMSVVCIGNTLRHSKTAVYANCCDLVISFTPSNPIIETKIWQ